MPPENGELVEITVSATISMPPAYTFEQALMEALLRQPWASTSPDGVEYLYINLMSHPEIVALLEQYPFGVTLEELLAKINELILQIIAEGDGVLTTWENLDEHSLPDLFLDQVYEQLVVPFWPNGEKLDFFTNNIRPLAPDPLYFADLDTDTRETGWRTFTANVKDALFDPDNQLFPPFVFIALGIDSGQLEADIANLYQLLLWIPVAETEYNLIEQLKTALADERLESMRIGDQVVPVPFKAEFDQFLAAMVARQDRLIELSRQYFGEASVGEGGNIWDQAADWLINDTPIGLGLDIFEYGATQIAELAGYMTEISSSIWGFSSEDALDFMANGMSGVPFIIADAAASFRWAWDQDKWQALQGVAWGMGAASPLGFLVDVFDYLGGIRVYGSGENVSVIAARDWGSWRALSLEGRSDAFKAAVPIGSLGMTASDLIVSPPRPVDSPQMPSGFAPALEISSLSPGGVATARMTMVATPDLAEAIRAGRIGINSYFAMSDGDDDKPEQSSSGRNSTNLEGDALRKLHEAFPDIDDILSFRPTHFRGAGLTPEEQRVIRLLQVDLMEQSNILSSEKASLIRQILNREDINKTLITPMDTIDIAQATDLPIDIAWLERGGLEHIVLDRPAGRGITNHARDLIDSGFIDNPADVPDFIMDLIGNHSPTSVNPATRGRPGYEVIYELLVEGEIKEVIVALGDNGYIVSVYPR